MKLKSCLILISLVLINTISSAQTIPANQEPMVWYQIFPERFRNGLDANDPTVEVVWGKPEGWEISPWTKDWYSFSDWEKQVSSKFYDFTTRRRYGGDLVGVLQKLDYLDSLGINVIYFNPIFDARTMHKYDASYYHHVDRYFGTNSANDAKMMQDEDPGNPQTWKMTSADSVFITLISEAHKRGIKIVLDGVFNHTGPEFWAFQDLKKNQQQSRFKNWYKVTAWDNPNTQKNEFDYEGWWGYKGLPELNQIDGNLVPEVKEHIFAISKRWMDPNHDGDPSDGIDGWRLDVAEELGMNFWIDWHKYIKSINPKIFTVAEIWDTKAKDYISDSTFYGTMNYPMTRLIHSYFINRSVSPKKMVDSVMQLNGLFSDEANRFNLNILDSHDSERVLTAIVNRKNPFKENTKLQDNPNSEYSVQAPQKSDIELFKQILVFQFMQPGIPHIYYGNEVGMWGADDPDNRKPMVWADLKYEDETHHPYKKTRTPDKVEVNKDLFSFYQKLVTIRKSHQVFVSGEYKISYENGLIRLDWKAQDYTISAFFTEKPSVIAIDTIREKNKGQRIYDLLSDKSLKEDIPLGEYSYCLIKINHAN
ncbi:glycoside hydrolase family 13 protein [bacterium]|nr:MAG: glycoside hydrolase family 13 protein [bacterium]